MQTQLALTLLASPTLTANAPAFTGMGFSSVASASIRPGVRKVIKESQPRIPALCHFKKRLLLYLPSSFKKGSRGKRGFRWSWRATCLCSVIEWWVGSTIETPGQQYSRPTIEIYHPCGRIMTLSSRTPGIGNSCRDLHFLVYSFIPFTSFSASAPLSSLPPLPPFPTPLPPCANSACLCPSHLSFPSLFFRLHSPHLFFLLLQPSLSNNTHSSLPQSCNFLSHHYILDCCKSL